MSIRGSEEFTPINSYEGSLNTVISPHICRLAVAFFGELEVPSPAPSLVPPPELVQEGAVSRLERFQGGEFDSLILRALGERLAEQGTDVETALGFKGLQEKQVVS